MKFRGGIGYVPMPISSLINISLANVFQDLPYLVASDGLYVDVSGYGSPTNDYVGTVVLKVCTYTKDGLLKESRLLNKMNHLPPCSLPCNYCSDAEGKTDVAEDRCPMCLAMCKATWKKEVSSVKLHISSTGEIVLDELGHIGNILYSFLSPRILQLVANYEATHEYTEMIFEEAQKKKQKEGLRRRNTDESP